MSPSHESQTFSSALKLKLSAPMVTEETLNANLIQSRSYFADSVAALNLIGTVLPNLNSYSFSYSERKKKKTRMENQYYLYLHQSNK